jgi:hemoglobin-like flavoprotein
MKQGPARGATALKQRPAKLQASPTEPAMNTEQITLVRHSFTLVQPIAAEAAALFYAHLFKADPSLKSLFKSDMKRQGEQLMNMIAAAVQILDRPPTLMPVLRSLGARHLNYGVRDEHYASVGTALIQTLQDGLGAQFTPEVRAAWIAMYRVVSHTMMQAAHEAGEEIRLAAAA